MKLRQLKDSADRLDVTRLSIISGPNRGAEWLNAVPMKSCGLALNNEEMRINVGLRLGAKLMREHPCKFCGATVNQSGEHALSCRSSKGRFHRHSECNDIIARALNTAKYSASLEPSNLLRSDGRRPDGVTRSPWARGRCLVWDFTCVDSLAPSRIMKPSCAATEAETRKMTKYQLLNQTYEFTPVASCTLGSWSEKNKNS